MRTLAIDCSTEACSVARWGGPKEYEWRTEILGRGHAERLIPMIAEFADRGRAERIIVGLGPGSFTGVRIGLAAARALAIAWTAEVLGVPSMKLVVEEGMAKRITLRAPYDMPPHHILACMNGGHGEWFVQPYDHCRDQTGPCVSLAPEEAVTRYDQPIVIGNRAKQFVDLRGSGEAIEALPNASHAIHGGPLTRDLTPIYGRGPDATPQKPRA